MKPIYYYRSPKYVWILIHTLWIAKCKGIRGIVSDILIFITHDSCYLNGNKGEKTSWCMRFACIKSFFNWNFIIYNGVIETDEEFCLNAQVEREMGWLYWINAENEQTNHNDFEAIWYENMCAFMAVFRLQLRNGSCFWGFMMMQYAQCKMWMWVKWYL